jgi:hypothetical protein
MIHPSMVETSLILETDKGNKAAIDRQFRP